MKDAKDWRAARGRLTSWGAQRISKMVEASARLDGSPKWARSLPSELGKKILDLGREMIKEAIAIHHLPSDFMAKLIKDELVVSPFSEEHSEEVAKRLADLVGLEHEGTRIAERQAFRLKLISALLKRLDDPDWQLFNELERGVPL